MNLFRRGVALVVLFFMIQISGFTQERTTQPKPDNEKRTNDPKDDKRNFILEFRTDQGQRVYLTSQHDPWADRVVRYKAGKPAPKQNRDPAASLGKPGRNAKSNHNSVALGHGGVLVVEFVDNALVDGPGDDLVIFEVGKAIEPMKVAISTDGQTWIHLKRAPGAKSTLDIGPFVQPDQQFRFVKITDGRSKRSNGSKVPGADVDAVGAINSVPVKK